MYSNVGAGGQQLPFVSQASPLGTPFYGAGSEFVRTGLSAYGERIFGSSSEYVQSNISRYLANPQYYFQVDDDYVRNKLKVVLFPFLHRGHWTRITEPMTGRLSYKPPIYDINAPDLYIPLMAFFSYIVLGALVLGLNGKFQPEVVNWLFVKALVGWFLQVMLLKLSLFSLISGEAPFLDVVAYAGYAFTGISLAVLGKLIWAPAYYILLPWTCLCMGVFLVKTMKRVLYAESSGLLYNFWEVFLRTKAPRVQAWAYQGIYGLLELQLRFFNGFQGSLAGDKMGITQRAK